MFKRRSKTDEFSASPEEQDFSDGPKFVQHTAVKQVEDMRSSILGIQNQLGKLQKTTTKTQETEDIKKNVEKLSEDLQRLSTKTTLNTEDINRNIEKLKEDLREVASNHTVLEIDAMTLCQPNDTVHFGENIIIHMYVGTGMTQTCQNYFSFSRDV